MRPPRMTTRRWMIAVVLVSLALAAFVARREHLRRIVAIQVAEADYQNAVLTREVSEIAVVEYREAVYKAEQETVLGEIALAESEKKRAEDRLEWSNRMLAKGAISEAQNIADQLSREQKNFALEQATPSSTCSKAIPGERPSRSSRARSRRRRRMSKPGRQPTNGRRRP